MSMWQSSEEQLILHVMRDCPSFKILKPVWSEIYEQYFDSIETKNKAEKHHYGKWHIK